MSNVNPTLPNQLHNAGGERALSLEVYSGLLYRSYMRYVTTEDVVMQQNITSGSSYQFIFTGRGGEPTRHDAGTEVTGGEGAQVGKKTIVIDDKELIWSAALTNPQTSVSHYDLAPVIMDNAAMQMAYKIDNRRFRVIINGARQAARGANSEFPGGTLVRRNAATVAAAYPMSEVGSKQLQEDLAYANQLLREKFVPEGMDKYVFLTPYLARVLRQDLTLFSNQLVQDTADRSSPYDLPARVEGFIPRVSMNIPSTDLSSIDDETAYKGNYSKTAWVATAGPECVGHLTFGGTDGFGVEPLPPTYFPYKRATMYGAVSFGGMDWLRPELCIEGYAHTSDYTLSNGVYGL